MAVMEDDDILGGDDYDYDTPSVVSSYVVLYKNNGVEIIEDLDSDCIHIRTDKYYVFWTNQNYLLIGKAKTSAWEFDIKLDINFGLFCDYDKETNKVIYTDINKVNGFVERFLNLKAFL